MFSGDCQMYTMAVRGCQDSIYNCSQRVHQKIFMNIKITGPTMKGELKKIIT